MGQKTNPNIQRLGLTKHYLYKHIEKKPQEESLYSFEILQIKKFVFNFLKLNGVTIMNCKIQYSNENLLQIFINYYPSNEFNFLINELPLTYPKIKYNYVLPKNATSAKYNCNVSVNSKTSIIIKQLLRSIHIFLKKRVNISFIMSQINKKNVLTLKQIKTIKKEVVKLKNYENNEFYKKVLTYSFIFLQNLQSSNLLATLIANELSKIKRHNFFFRFLKEALELIKINSLLKLKGIKIQIKGRINGRPRAKKKTIIIGKNVPILSMVTDVDYSEKVSYTANGTLGIKVWTF
jgi:hypothetical protein